MAGSFSGKVAFITGGSGSIGAATARRLAADGAAVVLMARDDARLKATQASVEEATPGAEVLICTGDACDVEQLQQALRRAYAWRKRLDIVVPTVGGGGPFRPLLGYTSATFGDVVNRNLLSAFMAIRYGAPLMGHGGAIVCISATSAQIPIAGLAAAACAKGAVDILVRQAAEELACASIRVNAVRPGLTRGGNTGALMTGDALQHYQREIPLALPLGRVGHPDDVAAAIHYLAGDAASWVTGQSYAVDGGQELRRNPDLLHALTGASPQDALAAARADMLKDL
jgi:NAD(P)-dependent dehydrogenase (short-subunit alcohol dehydrogenase family)